MSVTIQDVNHIASLARLAFTEEEKRAMMDELNTILGYMEQLNRLDTASVEPLTHVIDLKNVFRQDDPAPCLPREEALRNAPASNEKFFKVPRVLGDR